MAKEIKVTLKRISDGVELILSPLHADNLMKASKFYEVSNDPREATKEPKKRKKDTEDKEETN